MVAAILEVGTNLGFILKEKQIEAIDTFVRGKDVFVSLTTGYGKSTVGWGMVWLRETSNEA